MKQTRMARVNSEIQRQLAEIFSELGDKLISSSIISILKVDTAADLSISKIYISVLGDKENQLLVVSHLTKNKKLIRYNLAHKIKLRIVPDLVFIADEFEEKSRRVLDLFKKIEGEKDEV